MRSFTDIYLHCQHKVKVKRSEPAFGNFHLHTCPSEDRRRAEQGLLWKRRMCHTSGCSWNACEQERESKNGRGCGDTPASRPSANKDATPHQKRRLHRWTSEERAGKQEEATWVLKSHHRCRLGVFHHFYATFSGVWHLELPWKFGKQKSGISLVCDFVWSRFGSFWLILMQNMKTVSHKLVIVWWKTSYFPHMDSIRRNFCFACLPAFVFLSQNTDTFKTPIFSASLGWAHSVLSNTLWSFYITGPTTERRRAVISVFLLEVRGRAFVSRLLQFLHRYFLSSPACKAFIFCTQMGVGHCIFWSIHLKSWTLSRDVTSFETKRCTNKWFDHQVFCLNLVEDEKNNQLMLERL